MFDHSQKQRAKRKIRASIRLTDGLDYEGYVFCTMHERFGDSLNDDRPFMPFETIDGEIMYFSKDCVRSAIPRDGDAVEESFANPYHVIGVEENASIEMIKEAYHKQVRNVHPDRLNGLDLPKEMINLANDIMARLNAAYSRLVEKTDTKAAE